MQSPGSQQENPQVSTSDSILLEQKPKWKSLSHVWPSATPWTDNTVHGTLQVRILEWVAIPFSSGSSKPRDQTQVSRIAGGFFTS